MVSDAMFRKTQGHPSHIDPRLRERTQPETAPGGPGQRRVEPSDNYSKVHEAHRTQVKTQEAQRRNDDYARSGATPRGKAPTNAPAKGR